MKNRMILKFPSLSQNESLSRLAVSGFASQLDPCIDELSDIKTAVSEAVTNAIVHGYPDKVGQIELDARIYDGGILYVGVKDRGRGIEDVHRAMEPLFSTGSSEERAGLGFTVMESFTDSMKVRSSPGKGTTVILIKKLRSRSSGKPQGR